MNIVECWKAVLFFTLLFIRIVNTTNNILFNSTFTLFEKSKNLKAICENFNPFKILPENSKYQIGGAIPLHEKNCIDVNIASVQEFFAIQWAFNYWNQKSHFNNESCTQYCTKIGLFLGDSCSRSKEAISQTLRFLDTIGFYNPIECSAGYNIENFSKTGSFLKSNYQRLIGILMPKDIESASSLANILKSFDIPVGVFNSGAAEKLVDANIENIIITAPLISNYVEALIHLILMLDSNLVTIIDGGETDYESLQITIKVIEQLKENKIYVNEVIGYNHTLLPTIIHETDSKIIVSLVTLSKLKSFISFNKKLIKMPKLWVSMDLETQFYNYNDTEDTSDNYNLNFLMINNQLTLKPNEIKMQMVILHRPNRLISEFNDHFIKVLINNYNLFPLLSLFVEELFNCTTLLSTKNKEKQHRLCSKMFANNNAEFKKMYRQSNNIESLINLIYAFALISDKIETTPQLKKFCEEDFTLAQCYKTIIELVLLIDYQYKSNDPLNLYDEILSFDKHLRKNKKYYLQSNLIIEARLLELKNQDGVKIFELKTASPFSKFNTYSMPSKLQAIHSKCSAYHSYCGQCEHVKKFDNDEVFLSNPRKFSLYLAGIFDFHDGPNCEILRSNENIALPLAFSYAVSSYTAQVQMQESLFSGLEFGAILVDGCSSDRKVMEFLVESENGCYRFTQADRNWTIVSGSTFGYISTSSPSFQGAKYFNIEAKKIDLWPSIVERFFTSKNSPAPVVNSNNLKTIINSSKSIINNEKMHQKIQQIQPASSSIFSAMPSYESIAIVIIKYLHKMHWEFINVIVDETDFDSIAIFNEFNKLINLMDVSICISETLFFNNDLSTPQIFNTNGPNVTLLFTGPNAAANYLSEHLRQNIHLSASNELNSSNIVHVLIGNSVDFFFYDPTNIVHYSGAISIQPKNILNNGFRNWLSSITPLSLPETWFWRYIEERWKCALSLRNVDLYQGKMCTGDELLNVDQMGRMTKAGYLIKSTQILLAAADQIYQKLCPEEFASKSSYVCDAFILQGRLQIRNLLAQTQIEDEFEVLEFQSIDHYGNFGYTLLANFTLRQGFYTINDYKSYVNGVPIKNKNPVSRCVAPFCSCAVTNVATKLFLPLFDNAEIRYNIDENNNYDSSKYFFSTAKLVNSNDNFLTYGSETIQALSVDNWRSDNVKYVFLVLTLLFCFFALATLVLISVKMYFRIVKGNQSLGLTLLGGIFALFFCVFLYIFDASETICSYRVIMHSFAHTICFSVLIVKAVQLKNAETLGNSYNNQISYWNYWLLLIFIFAVQVVICFRWILSPVTSFSVLYLSSTTKNEKHYTSETANTAIITAVVRCLNTNPEFLLAEGYSFALLFFSLILNAFNRNIKRNYKEAKWLFAASFFCLLIFICWIVAQNIDYITIIELYLCGNVLLLFVFGPKIYVLLSYEPVIVESCNDINKAEYCEKEISILFDNYNKFHCLSKTDLNHSRSISQELSTRTGSSYLNSHVDTFKKSQISNSSSDITIYDNQNKSVNNKKILHKNDFNYLQMPNKLSQNLTTLDSSFLISNFDTAHSDNEGLSSVLQTVLRKKKSPLLSKIRRSHSEIDNSNQTSINNNISSLNNSTYLTDSSFVFIPNITHTTFKKQSNNVKPIVKKRSTSQKLKK